MLPTSAPIVLAALLFVSLCAQQQDPPPPTRGRELRGQEVPLVPAIANPEERESIPVPFATGTWGEVRTELSKRGFDFEALLTTDGSAILSGGTDPGNTVLRSLLDAVVMVDAEKLLAWEGAKFLANFQMKRGDDVSDGVGDLQGYSNIDADDRTQLGKIWYQQELFDQTVRLKVGKADANTDFAYVENGFRFIQSSFGYSPTIVGFPSYPDSAFGFAGFVEPAEGFYTGVGIYDGALQEGYETGRLGPSTLFGQPSDLFLIVESGVRWPDQVCTIGPGRFALGVYRHTGTFDRFDGGTQSGAEGLYLTFDQIFHDRPEEDEPDRGFRTCFQYGIADPRISPIHQHFGAGITWEGFLAPRPHDAVGLGCSYVEFTRQAGAGLSGNGELAVELFYSLRITPWMRLKPDLQYIQNPGGQADVSDALVATLRLSISF